MVKLGMIGEGESEVFLLSSRMFRSLLDENNISYVPSVIDAEGKGNLENKNIESFINQLIKKGATQILILTDKDDAPCFTSVKEKVLKNVKSAVELIIVVPVKELEAWFIACSTSMSAVIGREFTSKNPENINEPFKFILKEINKNRKRKATFSKPKLTKKLLEKGFTITSAANHKYCPSAKYFLDKLTALGS